MDRWNGMEWNNILQLASVPEPHSYYVIEIIKECGLVTSYWEYMLS